jgi:hypothetical protein
MRASLLCLLVVALFPVVAQAQATDVYVTPSGAAVGNCPAATSSAPNLTPAQFSTSSNWGSGASQIGAGTTVLFCGTLTASAGSGPVLTFQGSGASGDPIVFNMDTGSAIQAPYWGSEAVNLNGQSYITFNGQNSGSILATLNGASGASCPGGTCSYQQSTGNCITTAGGTNVTIENVLCGPLYVHVCPSGEEANCPDEGGANTGGIWTRDTQNYAVTGNTIQGGWACSGYTATQNDSNVTFSGNNIYNCNIPIEPDVSGGVTLSNLTIQGNLLHDGVSWTDAANNNHHDGMHIFVTSSSSVVSNLVINGNFIYGNWGNGLNAFIFVEGWDGGFANNFPNVEVINNILEDDTPSTVTGQAGNGLISISYSNGAVIANNVCNGNSCNDMYEDTNETFENNIVMNGALCQCHYSNNISATAWDYNVYFGLTAWDGSAGSFSAWKSTCASSLGLSSCDSHSTSGSGSGLGLLGVVTLPVSSPTATNYELTSVSTAVVKQGQNLSSLGIAPLDSDYLGTARPSSGTCSTPGSSSCWDIGAFAFGSTSGTVSSSVLPPSNLTATVNSAQ